MAAVQIASFPFMLVIIDRLMELGHFTKEVSALKDKYWKWDDYRDDPIPELEHYFRQLEIQDTDLEQITTLEFDGGLEIYQTLIPNWDGEDGQFDIGNIEDITCLKKLQRINVISMITTTAIAPLLLLPDLKQVSWHEIAKDELKAQQLREKGIEVTA